MKSEALAVAVVRIQVAQLHGGHHYLINSMLAIHKNVLVVIGDSEARLTPDDPLTYEMRAALLKSVYPAVSVARLADQPSDEAWSEELDRIINEHKGGVDPHGDAILYGGRDSFLKHYTGMFRSFELPPVEPVSGTEQREAIEPRNTEDFRAGMIYAAKHKFPVSYQCVDAAIYQGGKFLMGQKKRDGNKWRFIGGFVSPQDPTLEAAARREVMEETGIDSARVEYIGSERINDFRYPADGKDALMSALFFVTPMFGTPKAGDDIDALCWMTLDKMQDNIVLEHIGLAEMLEEYMEIKL